MGGVPIPVWIYLIFAVYLAVQCEWTRRRHPLRTQQRFGEFLMLFGWPKDGRLWRLMIPTNLFGSLRFGLLWPVIIATLVFGAARDALG